MVICLLMPSMTLQCSLLLSHTFACAQLEEQISGVTDAEQEATVAQELGVGTQSQSWLDSPIVTCGRVRAVATKCADCFELSWGKEVEQW